MASNPEQLVTVAEVAAALNTMPMKITSLAGKRLAAWWDGSPALTFADAQRIADVIREEQAEGDRRYLENLDAQQREVDDMFVAAQERAAQRERERPTRVGGLAVSFPPGEREWAE
jgi:hypothetical protein